MTPKEQLLFRPANMDDLDACLGLARQVGTGMTSMPQDKSKWEARLERTVHDFTCSTPSMNNDEYFMVLVDQNTQQVIGSGALYAGIGVKIPFYSYKLTTLVSTNEKLDLTMKTRVLNLVNDFTGATEIGSLFLTEAYRRDRIGKFLSRARMLLLADFPDRFDQRVFAELRGWTDQNGNSPFWEHLGKKFFDLSFENADFISAVDGWQFISDLMPKHPVYLDLLPQDAQAVIGKPHDHGVGAMKILEREGFRYGGYIDIFDAGPTVECPLHDIKTVAESCELVVSSDSLTNESQATMHIISNSNLRDYRITRAKLQVMGNEALLDSQSKELLDVKTGDPIRAVSF